jgi:acetylglutamate kinase
MNNLFVIKIGGNVIDDEEKLSSFLSSFVSIKEKKILVHGGGKLATKLASQLGIEQQLLNGRRITDAETLQIVTMVYAGAINKNIVAQLQAKGSNAIGLCGADGNIIQSHKRQHASIDYGFVGDIDAVNTSLINSLLDQEVDLVVSPITHDREGQLLNTNADTIASALAVAMSKQFHVRLIYCFEKKGVLENVEEEDSVIPLITKEKYQTLLSEQKLFAGILPKIDNAFSAIDLGVKEVLIGDANDLIRNTTGESVGTLITT